MFGISKCLWFTADPPDPLALSGPFRDYTLSSLRATDETECFTESRTRWAVTLSGPSGLNPSSWVLRRWWLCLNACSCPLLWSGVQPVVDVPAHEGRAGSAPQLLSECLHVQLWSRAEPRLYLRYASAWDGSSSVVLLMLRPGPSMFHYNNPSSCQAGDGAETTYRAVLLSPQPTFLHTLCCLFTDFTLTEKIFTLTSSEFCSSSDECFSHGQIRASSG